MDFDGVLHPEFCHESKHFSCLPLLEAVLRQVPACDVVVTSTWRHQYSIEALRDRFSSDIQPRVIDTTPRFSLLEDVPDVLVGYERETALLPSAPRGVARSTAPVRRHCVEDTDSGSCCFRS